MIEKLSLEGLNFEATKIDISNHVLTITLNNCYVLTKKP